MSYAIITVLIRTAPSITFTSDFVINGTLSRLLYLDPYLFLWKMIFALDFIALDFTALDFINNHIHVTFLLYCPTKIIALGKNPFLWILLPPVPY